MIAVPPAGIAAMEPGKGVLSEISTAPVMRAVMPSQLMKVHCRELLILGTRLANPPNANSHARVGELKNAHGWCVRVHHTQAANETTRTSDISQINRRSE